MVLKTTAASLKWNVSTLVNMMKKNKVDFRVAIQRGDVWEPARKSLLIHSILVGWPTSVFYFNRVDGIYEGLEGQQRGKTIYDYTQDKFPLGKNIPPVITDDGEVIQVAKRKFSGLPEDLQNRILQYGLDIYYFENMTTEEKLEFFTRINNGKPVTKAEIARIKVKDRKTFLSFCEHEAIFCNVSEAGRRNGTDEDIIENVWCLCYNESPNLLKSYTEPILSTIDVTDEQKQELTYSFDYMAEFFRKKGNDKQMMKKVRKPTHLTMIGYMGYLAQKQEMSQDEFVEKTADFFSGEDNASISKEYNDACLNSTSRPDKVQARINEVKKALF